MWSRLGTVLASSALSIGVAVTSVNASESRNTNFLFTCDGQNKTITFTVSNLGNNANRFIQGAEISLFENQEKVVGDIHLWHFSTYFSERKATPTSSFSPSARVNLARAISSRGLCKWPRAPRVLLISQLTVPARVASDRCRET